MLASRRPRFSTANGNSSAHLAPPETQSALTTLRAPSPRTVRSCPAHQQPPLLITGVGCYCPAHPANIADSE
ncbi:hypothetical protein GN956_G22619 [Arapaima gigas]